MVLKIKGRDTLIIEVGRNRCTWTQDGKHVVEETGGAKIQIELFNRMILGLTWWGPFLLPDFAYWLYNNPHEPSRRAFPVVSVHRFHWMTKHKYACELLGVFVPLALKIRTSKKCLAFDEALTKRMRKALA